MVLEDRKLNNPRAKGGCEFNIWLRLGSLADPTVIKVVVVHSESNVALSVLGGLSVSLCFVFSLC